jgi:hypothetical protein
MQPAVTPDWERELRRGMAEARAGDYKFAVQLPFTPYDGHQGIRVHVGSPLELPDHYAPHPFEARLVPMRHPNLITRPETRADHCPRILVRCPENRERFSRPLTILFRDSFQILFWHPDLAKTAGQSELLDQ